MKTISSNDTKSSVESFDQQTTESAATRRSLLSMLGGTAVGLFGLSGLAARSRAARTGNGRVIITFDDSAKTAKTVAKPIMDRYGFRGVVGLITRHIKQSGKSRVLTVADCRALRRSGWQIASHTHTHPDLRKLSNAGIARECRRSKRFLVNNGLNSGATTLIYPYGGVNNRVANIARKYFTFGFGSRLNLPPNWNDRLWIGRVPGHEVQDAQRALRRAAANDRTVILMYHQIANPGTGNDTSVADFKRTMALINRLGMDVIVPTEYHRLVRKGIK